MKADLGVFRPLGPNIPGSVRTWRSKYPQVCSHLRLPTDRIQIGYRHTVFEFVYLIGYRIRAEYFLDIYESNKDLGTIEIEDD